MNHSYNTDSRSNETYTDDDQRIADMMSEGGGAAITVRGRDVRDYSFSHELHVFADDGGPVRE